MMLHLLVPLVSARGQAADGSPPPLDRRGPPLLPATGSPGSRSRSLSRNATSSDASELPQHYLQAHRRWNPYSKADTFSWFDRVSVLEKGVNVITCGIEKNGITLLDSIIAKVLGKEFEWWASSPSMVGLSLEAFNDRLGDASNSWRKLVVYRDPMERFLSAYRSKCLLGDSDGRTHCHQVFKLNNSQISVLNVASRLAKYGHYNPHWATQSSFCGGTVGSMWTSYTHHVSCNNLSGIADAFEGRVSPETFEKIRILLRPPAPGSHITNAKAHVQTDLESAEVRRLLYDFYSDDYHLFSTEGAA